MSDYREMYRILFQETTKAISALREAQKKTEEIYMSGRGPGIVALRSETEPEDEEEK